MYITNRPNFLVYFFILLIKLPIADILCPIPLYNCLRAGDQYLRSKFEDDDSMILSEFKNSALPDLVIVTTDLVVVVSSRRCRCRCGVPQR